MDCCKCRCSFAKCVEEHKKELNKEFNEMITTWMKNHPEVKSVCIRDKYYCLLPSTIICQNKELDVSVHFK